MDDDPEYCLFHVAEADTVALSDPLTSTKSETIAEPYLTDIPATDDVEPQDTTHIDTTTLQPQEPTNYFIKMEEDKHNNPMYQSGFLHYHPSKPKKSWLACLGVLVGYHPPTTLSDLPNAFTTKQGVTVLIHN